MKKSLIALIINSLAIFCLEANPSTWRYEWPDTDFAKHSILYEEVASGGPPKDGIPSIDAPLFTPLSKADHLGAQEPVISVEIGNEARAYPLQVLMYHEVVNDIVGDVPILVTYCPLCNTALAFERTVEQTVLDFGTTGQLRHSNLIMYDRQTQSWWQQFNGEAIAGSYTGTELRAIPVRIESIERFAKHYPKGLVLVPNDPWKRRYGINPYAGYDSSPWPFMYLGTYTDELPPLSYVVVVGKRAWLLDLLIEKKSIIDEDLIISWKPGQNSALDRMNISRGRDIGNVIVQKKTLQGLEDVAYSVTFAFSFRAFCPEGTLYEQWDNEKARTY